MDRSAATLARMSNAATVRWIEDLEATLAGMLDIVFPPSTRGSAALSETDVFVGPWRAGWSMVVPVDRNAGQVLIEDFGRWLAQLPPGTTRADFGRNPEVRMHKNDLGPPSVIWLVRMRKPAQARQSSSSSSASERMTTAS